MRHFRSRARLARRGKVRSLWDRFQGNVQHSLPGVFGQVIADPTVLPGMGQDFDLETTILRCIVKFNPRLHFSLSAGIAESAVVVCGVCLLDFGVLTPDPTDPANGGQDWLDIWSMTCTSFVPTSSGGGVLGLTCGEPPTRDIRVKRRIGMNAGLVFAMQIQPVGLSTNIVTLDSIEGILSVSNLFRYGPSR